MLQGDSGQLLQLRDLYASRAQELQEALQGGAAGRPGGEEEEEQEVLTKRTSVCRRDCRRPPSLPACLPV